MAIEPITGAASTYQSTPQVKKVEQSYDSGKTGNYSGTDGAVSEISKNTRVVDSASNSDSKQSGENGKDTERQPSEETMKQALSNINKRLNNTECIFGVHEETNRVTIQIIDKDTKEVIKELPPEKTLDMIAKAWELAGIMVDERL